MQKRYQKKASASKCTLNLIRMSETTETVICVRYNKQNEKLCKIKAPQNGRRLLVVSAILKGILVIIPVF